MEKRMSPRVKAVVRRSEPQLQPMVRELEVGPEPNLNKLLPMVPVPQISLEGILSPLIREEDSLLRVEISGMGKETPPKKSHLLNKEPEE